jgi:hypothetical protein
MTLFEKLKSIYPQLNINDFTTEGTILIGSDEEGNEIIESWNHDLPQPTTEDLAKFN